jgi:hypothetical protein
MNFNTIDNSVTIMNHKIIMDDLIEQTYYTTNIAIINDISLFNTIYIDKLTEKEKKQWYKFIRLDYRRAIDISHKIIPVFPIIDTIDKYYIYISVNISGKQQYQCIQIKPESVITWYFDWIINKTLKFKIKQQRITKNIQKELEQSNKRISILENKMKENDIYYKKIIDKLENERYYLWFIIIIIIVILH